MPDDTSIKYSRASKLYDIVEWPMEQLLFKRLREKAVGLARGRVLEVGAGTGKNFSYYDRSSVDLTAIDFSRGMLEIAKKREVQMGWDDLKLMKMDVEHLVFEDNSFDTVVSTFVFCTVPHPQKGLEEVFRVLKPQGKAIFLEHMKSRHRMVNAFLWMMNLFSTRMLGTSMLRGTQKSIEAAGFNIQSVENKLFDVIRLIIATKA